MKHRVLSVFLALMVVLLSVRVPDVDALTVSDDDYKYKPSMVSDGTKQLFIYDDTTYDFLQNYDIDNYYRVEGQKEAYELIVADAEDGNICGYAFPDSDDIFIRIYRDFTNELWVLEYADSSRLYLHYRPDEGILNFKCAYIRQFKFTVENGEIKPYVLQFYGERDLDILIETGVNTVMFPFFEKYLFFDVQPAVSVDMDLTTLPQQFTLTAINETNNYYNYVFYISSSPASSGVQKSFSDAVYIMSSTQWCMKYSWSSLIPGDDVSISDWVKDAFGRVLDPWGNIFNVDDSYMGRHGSGSSDDGIYYYTLSQQKKCPFYLIKPKDSRAHVIPYSALNLSLDTTYYANIIYLDTTDYGVVPSSNSWGAADTSHNNYRSHPLYNLNLISRFAVYSSTEFSVVNGNFTKDGDGLYDYKDVVDNSNPASSSATISSDDNSVSINNANSYDNSSTVSYINYGTIYHNCTWGSSGAGGSGSSIVAPTVPEFDFDQLTAGCGNFLKFVKHVFFECLPEIFTTMLLAAFAVVIYCRVWGR